MKDAIQAALALLAVFLLCALVLSLVGCGAADQRTETAARCASVRAGFGELQTELIERGGCDHVQNVSECEAHIVIREALVIATKEMQCPAP